MRSDGIQEPRPPTRSASATVSGHKELISTNYRLRVIIIGLLLLILTIVFYGADYLSQPGQVVAYLTWLRAIPLRALGDACFTSLIIGFTYEWFVRKEADAKLAELFFDQFAQQETQLAAELPQALTTDPTVIKQLHSPARVEEIVRAALQALIDDEQLGNEIYDGLIHQTLGYQERWANCHYEVTLSALKDDDVPDEVKDKYWDVFVTVSYETVLTKSQFVFYAAPLDNYNAEFIKRDYAELIRWDTSSAFPTLDRSVLDVLFCTVAGINLTITSEGKPDGTVVTTCDHPELTAMLGRSVKVSYRYKTKAIKRSHMYTVDISYPTNGIKVAFDYAETDISYVNVLDYFVSPERPQIWATPPENPHRKEVELQDWVFPKGGVVFGWILRSEMTDAFLELLAKERENLQIKANR